MVAAVFRMFVEESFDIRSFEISALQSSVFDQVSVNPFPQLRIYPIADRYAEALFCAIKNFIWNDSLERFFENV